VASGPKSPQRRFLLVPKAERRVATEVYLAAQAALRFWYSSGGGAVAAGGGLPEGETEEWAAPG